MYIQLFKKKKYQKLGFVAVLETREGKKYNLMAQMKSADVKLLDLRAVVTCISSENRQRFPRTDLSRTRTQLGRPNLKTLERPNTRTQTKLENTCTKTELDNTHVHN